MLRKAFEIQTYRAGRWLINAVFDDSQLACFEARRMYDSGLYPGVRVVEEVFDERDGSTKSRTLYNSTKVQQHNKMAVEKRAAVMKEVTADRQKRAVQRANRKKKSLNTMQILLLLFALAGGAIGVLIGLQLLQRFL